MDPKPISLQLYTLRERAKEDFFGVLKEVADIGYVGVEFAGLHGKDPAEVRKVLDDVGLVASSTHGPLVTAENLAQQVEAARALGYDMLISGWKREDWAGPEGVDRAAAAYRKAAKLLAPHALKMGYHNHWWEMVPMDGAYALDRFLAAAPEVRPQIDTYWACNFGKVDVPKLVKKYAARAPTLHVKDGPLVEGQPHTAVGKGRMDFRKVVGAADPKVLKWLIVELDHCATDMTQAVRDSYDYLVESGLAKGNR